MADNIVGLALGVTVPFVVVCAASFALRIYSRAYIVKSFGADDWAMVGAFIGWIGQQAITYSWIHYGAGRHLSEVSDEFLVKLRITLFVEEFYYYFEQLLIKMCFLLFYLRFLGKTPARKFIYATMALVYLQVGGTWIFYGLQCRPVDAFLHPELHPNAVCFTTGLAMYAPTIANLLVDIIILTLPIYPVWRHHTDVRRRLGLIAVMTLGGCTILVSSLRIIIIHQLAKQSDYTYIFGRIVIITTIEFVTAIVTANMPAMRSLYRYHVTKDLQRLHDDYEMGEHGTGDSSNAGSRSGRGSGKDTTQTSVRKVYPPGLRLFVLTQSEEELFGIRPAQVVETSEREVTSDSANKPITLADVLNRSTE
ncbi:hypothetical protein BDV97DRAFT_396067 [Delphinella strobiligena]|nr:hypothetical protein BDV97DRAFT_396067 [Delphinella strobiligena]